MVDEPPGFWYQRTSGVLMSVTVYHYKAFGIALASEMELPELEPHDSPADVVVRYGSVPEQLEDRVLAGPWYQVSPTRILLDVKEVGRFLISEGSDVVVDPADGALDQDVRLYFLGQVCAGLLHQRGALPLHASAIETDTGAVAFLGNSGAGKSTMATAFARLGHRILADDIVAVLPVADGVHALPGYPQVKLWADVCGHLGEDPEQLRRLRPEIEKFGKPVRGAYCQEPLPLQRIYLLEPGDGAQLGLCRVTGLDKIAALTQYTFRYPFLATREAKIPHFDLCARVAERAEALRLTRPRDSVLIDEAVELVRADLAASGVHPARARVVGE